MPPHGRAITLGPTESQTESRTTHPDNRYIHTSNESTTDMYFNGNETEGRGSSPSTSTAMPLTTASTSATSTEPDPLDDGEIMICIGSSDCISTNGLVIVSLVGFVMLILMPGIICSLIILLGCTCIKYRRLKTLMNHNSGSNADERNVEAETNISSNGMLEELEMEQNVAYSRKESCDYMYVIQNPYEVVN